jgi:Family of unknown function (DUF5681)
MTTRNIARAVRAPKLDKLRRRRPAKPPIANTNEPDEEYRVGPGRPPREFQFKPGQSGNPKGAKRKPKSIVPDLRAYLGRSLNDKMTLKQGDQDRVVTLAKAGIEQLVLQFAQGDRHARRDLIALAKALSFDLTAGYDKASDHDPDPHSSERDAALIADYVRRHAPETKAPTPIEASSPGHRDGVDDETET